MLAPLIPGSRVDELLGLAKDAPEYLLAAALVVTAPCLSCSCKPWSIPRAVLIILMGLPLASMGAWALWRQETLILIAATAGLVHVLIGLAAGNRINGSLARMAITAPFVAVFFAVALQDVPAKAGLGVENWSWFDRPEKQIAELEKVLGEGRRLPVERLMSWSDLRFDGSRQSG
jgi:hypothetical protein